MNKAMFLLLALLAITAHVFAGGQRASAPTTPTVVFGEDPFEFQWYWNFEGETAREFATDYAAEVYVQEQFGITIDLIDTGGAAEQRYTTILASGDLPDVMTVAPWQVPELVENGLVVPLDSFLDDSYILETYGSGLLNLLRSEDGQLYEIRDWMISGEQGNGNGGWMVQRAVYEDLGEPPLETFDDLLSYLRLVQVEYPELTPLAVTQNFSGFAGIFAGFEEGAFISSINDLFAVPDGDRLSSIFESETFREAALYTARLFREGMIDPDSFALTRDLDDERLPNAAVVVSDNIARRGRVTRDILISRNPNNDWMPIWPVRKAGLDRNKIFVNEFNRLGRYSTVITTNAENPDAIFDFLDWSASDYGNLIYWLGPPGLFWTADEGFTEDGYPLDINPDYFTATADEVRFARGFGRIGNTTFVDGMEVFFNQLDPSLTNWTKRTQIAVTWQTSQDATQFANVRPAPTTREGIIYQEVEDIYDVAFSEMMYADSDAEVNAIINRAAQEARAAGIDELLDFMTEHWQENLSRLNN